ncbi:hypothetical protein F3Y22_tig00116954pilonHSYRG00139 [Hibiscus syriacus]|uniref:NusB/RsmB/TIM44 domain-containing protein n=1 Tax=Hibiscus syriacus TaxID=106335 RepID=A0A6A2WM79_HIBSY|nr:hypothetical protein F3Y22_tig00116954pilonHSYRG00139 [Hibiscus syriacus]
MMICCCSQNLRDAIQACLRDYDKLLYVAVILIYIQIGCALTGSLGALYNGVLLANLGIALFALVAIESGSQILGRAYAVLLFCAIMLDISWFALFAHDIWNMSKERNGDGEGEGKGRGMLFTFSTWVSYTALSNESDEALGGAIYDPPYYSSLFDDRQQHNRNSFLGRDGIGGSGSAPDAETSLLKLSPVRTLRIIDGRWRSPVELCFKLSLHYQNPFPITPSVTGASISELTAQSSTPCKAQSSNFSPFHGTPVQDQQSFHKSKDVLPKIDKSGRFCSPRAARELALLIVMRRVCKAQTLFGCLRSGLMQPEDSLLQYNHMSFGGPPVTTQSIEEADELLRSDEEDSAIEAEVLSAPPKLVYSKLILSFTRKLLVATMDKWDIHVLVIDKVAPSIGRFLMHLVPEYLLILYIHSSQNEPAGRILELSILHLAMSEITVLGTRHPIVINEAVDLAKRFCDGAAPRVINGCLRTFVKDLAGTSQAQASKSKQEVPLEV